MYLPIAGRRLCPRGIHPKPVSCDGLNKRNIFSEIKGSSMEYKNWKYKVDDEGIIWLLCDKENSATNSLNQDVLKELDHLLDEFSKSNHKGLVIGSAKKSGFIAG